MSRYRIKKANSELAVWISGWQQRAKDVINRIANDIATDLGCSADKIRFADRYFDNKAATMLWFPELQKGVFVLLEENNDDFVDVMLADVKKRPSEWLTVQSTDDGLKTLSRAAKSYLKR
jgi:hypothetical protein